jgi:catechol 2,3-dioxygenase-like lactoylglutathione lyase family enzyme
MSQEKKQSMISRRALLQALGVAAVAAPVTAFGQGRCIHSFGSPSCNTSPIPPVFGPTGWKTVSLDHVTFRVADYQKEAAFYQALMGWKLRSDDGKQAVMDIGDWGSVIFKKAPVSSFAAENAGARRGGRGPVHAVVESFCFGIDPWNAKTVEAELRKRGMTPVADNGPDGFESFHVKDLDGFDLQIGNTNGLTKARRTSPPSAKLSAPAPFESTGWQTVWLDHFSFGVKNYKKAVSFYTNLLGWKPTYDEGSQNECMMGEVGDIIIRGGNPLDPNYGKSARRTGLDHISFGISPWDTDKVKAELEKRGLTARVDTSTGDEIHVAAFKSYHTFTPNGYNLQISYVTHDKRLTLANAVRPKPTNQ